MAEKFRGALVGAAVGDAFGATLEGAWSVSPKDLQRLERGEGQLHYTDDTHMTIGVAQSLVERRGFDGPHMAALFARNYIQEPWRGYGPGPPQVFSLLQEGVPWDQAGRSLFGGSGSFGNGAAMRVAPVALLAYKNIDHVIAVAQSTAIITHAHELGVEGAVLQACAVALALGRDPTTPIDSGAFIDTLMEQTHTPTFQQALERAKGLLGQAASLDRDAVVSQLGNGIEAHRSVPTAICMFLGSPQSFREVVLNAIGLGGDTDTIASMAGALAGAHVGLEDIPKEWRVRTEGVARLQELANALLPLADGTEQ